MMVRVLVQVGALLAGGVLPAGRQGEGDGAGSQPAV